MPDLTDAELAEIDRQRTLTIEALRSTLDKMPQFAGEPEQLLFPRGAILATIDTLGAQRMEIEGLTAELRRLREALIPFARMHTDDIDGKPLSDRIPCDVVYTLIYCESEERPTVGDVHCARTALGDGWRPKP